MFQQKASFFDMHFKYADVCDVADVECCFGVALPATPPGGP
jgi:hypothetical protein